MAEEKEEKKGGHSATYTTDKKKGGYLVRVIGPTPGEFVGREVPVTTRDKKTHKEKLVRLIWLGTDDGEISGYTGPCALYSFEPKPRDEKEEVPF